MPAESISHCPDEMIAQDLLTLKISSNPTFCLNLILACASLENLADYARHGKNFRVRMSNLRLSGIHFPLECRVKSANLQLSLGCVRRDKFRRRNAT